MPAVKEKLTDVHRANRLLFAQQYVGEGLDYWSRVIFTDEKTFCSTAHVGGEMTLATRKKTFMK